MTSDNLSHLRDVPARLKALHRSYVVQVKRIKDDQFLDSRVKVARLQDLASENQRQVEAIQATAKAKADEIRKSATSKVEVTEAAKLQILRALDGGSSWQDIARLCVAQNDRAGLAALREQLPWQAMAGKLGSEARPERLLRSVSTTLDEMEKPLLDAREQRNRQELRELDACFPALETSIKMLDQHYTDEQNPIHSGHMKPVEHVYNWIGLPGNVLASSYKLPINDETVAAP